MKHRFAARGVGPHRDNFYRQCPDVDAHESHGNSVLRNWSPTIRVQCWLTVRANQACTQGTLHSIRAERKLAEVTEQRLCFDWNGTPADSIRKGPDFESFKETPSLQPANQAAKQHPRPSRRFYGRWTLTGPVSKAFHFDSGNAPAP
jgi:hypothetical protein